MGRHLWPVFLLLIGTGLVRAEPVQVAVAANFAGPLKALVAQYRARQPQARVQVTVASTGMLAAQIRQGAPFDIFLAADARRPRALAEEGLLIPDTVRTYALGVLVLWAPPAHTTPPGSDALQQGRLSPVALANARTAPYGVAARAVLNALAVPDSVPRVRGENVAQSFHFAHSGAAAAAFVALSQARARGGQWWQVPASLYPPIVQQGGCLNRRPAVKAFYEFLFSDSARRLIRRAGYRVE